MQGIDVTGLNYLIPSPYPTNYNTIHNNNNIPTFQFQPFHNNPFQIHDNFTSPQSSGISSNSTSDETDEQNKTLINERKHRRMISNRESARRSRMRKQKHLDELWLQVMWLRNENHQLLDKLNHVSECHDQALQENAKLKKQTSELQEIIRDMHIHSPCPSFGPLEHVPCHSSYLTTSEYSSNQSISNNSMDFLA